MTSAEKVVRCPACGGVVEGTVDEELVLAAQRHTLDAHGYAVPAEHVLAMIEEW